MPPRIDTHVHLWDPARLRYAWLGSVPPLNRAFLPADFRAASAAAGLSKWVFVECGRDPAQNVEEAAWVSELAKSEPRLGGIVAHAAVEKGAGAEPELAALAALPLVRGVRRLLQDETDPRFCLAPDFIDGVRRAGRRGFSFDLCIRHHQLRAVTELVRHCPETTFVLDHLGKPGIRERLFQPWADDLRHLAALPNVGCKISGLTTEADPANWQASDLRPYLDHARDCFGPDRILFGGDWPVSTLATSYSRWVEVIENWASGAPETERRRLFHDNAVAFYRLGAAPCRS